MVPGRFAIDVLTPAEAILRSGHEEPKHLAAPPAALGQGRRVERRAKQDGTSVNQFVATTAVAEKLAAMSTGEFFAERRAPADFTAFDW